MEGALRIGIGKFTTEEETRAEILSNAVNLTLKSYVSSGLADTTSIKNRLAYVS